MIFFVVVEVPPNYLNLKGEELKKNIKPQKRLNIQLSKNNL